MGEFVHSGLLTRRRSADTPAPSKYRWTWRGIRVSRSAWPRGRAAARAAEGPDQRPAPGTALRRHFPAPFTPRAQATAGFNLMVSSRTSENPARIRAAAISRPLAADISSVAPGPLG